MHTPSHLGGHQGITHTDAAVLEYIIARHGVRSMLDVGCGPGGMRDLAVARGVSWLGVDGDPQVCWSNRAITCHDYTTGPFLAMPVDLIWCVEFVEHVAPEYVGNFLATFDAGRVLFLTHALPEQEGHHHVNCQPASYWCELLTARGWNEDSDGTNWCRFYATVPFITATGMLFTKEGS